MSPEPVARGHADALLADAPDDEPDRLPAPRMHVSISEVREFLNCPLRWWYRYRLGLWSDRTRAFFAVGNAVHFGLAAFYGADIRGEPRDPDRALAFYRQEWARQVPHVTWSDEAKDPMDTGDDGSRMLLRAVEEPDDWGEVRGVEETVYSELTHSRLGTLPVRMKSKLDLRTARVVVDHKTAAKRWPVGKEAGDMQATLYFDAVRQNFAEPEAVVFNVIVANKAPLVDRRPTRSSQDDIDRLYVIVRAMLDAEEKGAVYPNPSSFDHPTCEFRGLCDGWSGHPQSVPSGRRLQMLVPGLTDRTAGVR